MNATAPTTMPPIAPPDIDVDDPAVGGEDGVVEDSLELGVVADSLELVVVVDSDKPEVEVVFEDVRVAAINVAGSKTNELADGDAALNDEYVLLSTEVLMLTSVLWAELQHILIWPTLPVQTSLLIHHQYTTASLILRGTNVFSKQHHAFCPSPQLNVLPSFPQFDGIVQHTSP